MFSFRFTSRIILQKRNSWLQKQFLKITQENLWICGHREVQQKSHILNENIANCNLTNRKPFTMKIDSPEFKSLFNPALCQLITIFKENSFEIRIAGGAVRDLLLNCKPKDVDFATTARPEDMKLMFDKHSIKMINTKGEKHGTITARIDDQNFEITTLRIDIATDGRHAEVEFTTDWELDASRRDLTVNSMYLGLDGTVFDYFNGYEDLKKRRIAFVGNPAQRIKEDYLRILRYFRFYGRIADKPDNHDPECLRTIQENVSGLQRISGERIWLELQKLAVGNFSADLLKTMHKVGIFPLIGLPKDPNFEELNAVCNGTKNLKVYPVTIIASLLRTEEEMLEFHQRNRLSCFERDLGIFIIRNRNENISLDTCQMLIAYTKVKDAKEWVVELLKYKSEVSLLNDIQSWNVPKFPVSGHQLIAKGLPGGKKVGQIINSLTVIWAETGFKLTAEDLIEHHLPEVMNELGIKKIEKK